MGFNHVPLFFNILRFKIQMFLILRYSCIYVK